MMAPNDQRVSSRDRGVTEGVRRTTGVTPLGATKPNEVYSWDITKLKGPVKWVYYYLYVILDIFSRYVVGWMVAHRESAALAKRLIEDTCCWPSN